MDFWHAAIFGVVEGITEFLPISSTAHLILSAEILGIPQTEFLKSFEVVIQLGAILSVVTLYWRSFLDTKILKNIAASFVPTAILGLILYSAAKSLFDNTAVILWALLIGGVALIIFERWHVRKGSAERVEMTTRDAVIVGLCQSVAFIPGVSRAAATIVGGLALGLSRTTIAEYSFLLAVPTMAAATGLDLVKNTEVVFASGNFSILLLGFVVSYLVAMGAIKLLLTYVRKHNFTPFGYYRILIAILGFMLLV